MEINLELKNHCIQTEAKKKYEKLMSKYFKKGNSDRNLSILEEQIEGLKYFLEHADFGYLRTTYSFLNGNQRGADVTLNIPNSFEGMTLIHNDEVINLVIKNR